MTHCKLSTYTVENVNCAVILLVLSVGYYGSLRGVWKEKPLVDVNMKSSGRCC